MVGTLHAVATHPGHGRVAHGGGLEPKVTRISTGRGGGVGAGSDAEVMHGAFEQLNADDGKDEEHESAKGGDGEETTV